MSGIISGVIDFNNKGISKEIKNSMIETINSYKVDNIDYILRNNYLMVSGQVFITEENKSEVLPLHNNGLILVADAILDNREELIEVFSRDDSKVNKNITDSELILMSYKKWGEDCPKYLLGDFNFVIWNEKKQELFCVRDHMGSRSFYYTFNNGVFAFGTLSNLIFPKVYNDGLNERWLTDFFALAGPMHNSEAKETIYNGIYQVEAATTMIVKKDGITTNKYWNPLKELRPLNLKNHEEYKKKFLEIFKEAVNCRLRTCGDVGIMVSGGLDSGSIAAIATKTLKEQGKVLKGYSFVPLNSYKNKVVDGRIADESDFVEILKNYCGNLQVEYCRNDGINSLTNIDEFISIFEQPIKTIENSYWVTGMAKKCSEENVKVMLVGQNGNVSISFGDFFTHIQTLLHEGNIVEIIKEVNAANKRYGKPKKQIYSTIFANSIPYSIRKFRHRKEYTVENRVEDSVVKLDLAKKYNVEKRFEENDYNPIIAKTKTLKQIRKNILDAATLSHIAIMETKDSLKYGIIKRDPTKDKRIMEFCLSIPSGEYVHEGEERYLIRSAMEGYLPEEIRTNWRKRGRQSADWVDRLKPNWNNIFKAIKEALSDEDVQRYVDIPKIERLMDKYKNLQYLDDDIMPNEVKLILIPLVFYRFLLQYREMVDSEEMVVNS